MFDYFSGYTVYYYNNFKQQRDLNMAATNNMNAWTAMEDNILINHGATTPNKLLVDMLPGRTLGAIKGRLHKLDIRKDSNKEYSKDYTPEEDQILRRWFKLIGAETVQQRYLSHRTKVSIYSRAQRLGLTERNCMLPDEDIDLIMALFMDPEMTCSDIAEKFELSSNYVHRICYMKLEEFYDQGRITEYQYLRTQVLRIGKSAHRVKYLDRLENLIKANCYGMEKAHA